MTSTMTTNLPSKPDWNLSCFDPGDLFTVFDSSIETIDSKPNKKENYLRTNPSLNDFDPLLTACDSRDDPGIWSSEGGGTANQPPDRLSAELREIACQLARDNPTKEEEFRITLGDTVDDSSAKSERRRLRRISRKSLSSSQLPDYLGSSHKSKDNKQVTPPNSSPATPERKRTKNGGATTPTRESTPISPSKSIRKSIVSKLSPARRKSVSSPESTPSSSSPSPKDPRNMIASKLLPGRRKSISSPKSPPRTPSSSPKGPRSTIASKLSPRRRKSISAPDIDIPTLVKPSPTSFLKDAVTMSCRTSELDPSPHQVEIPSSQELLEHSLLCALLESYRDLGDQNFDFNTLKGIPCRALKAFVSLDSQSIPGLTPDQKPVIQAFLDCAKDIEVEGSFTHGDNNERSQVCVFSTRNHFIVVYRGTTEQQLKPGRSKHSAVNLDPDNPVLVYPPFRDAYFPLEKQVYGLLDTLVDKNPFCDVVFTGHSFGGALATIGAARFASARPMLRFFCHTFGSPKVGAHNFRQMVNALPNLKVMRVENESDPNAKVPADVGPFKWEHVGHTLTIHMGSGKPSLRPVTAYRFDNKKPGSASLLNIRKPENDIQAYVRAIEPFAMGKLPWVSLYAGEDVGEGVRGMNNEKRLIA